MPGNVETNIQMFSQEDGAFVKNEDSVQRPDRRRTVKIVLALMSLFAPVLFVTGARNAEAQGGRPNQFPATQKYVQMLNANGGQPLNPWRSSRADLGSFRAAADQARVEVRAYCAGGNPNCEVILKRRGDLYGDKGTYYRNWKEKITIFGGPFGSEDVRLEPSQSGKCPAGSYPVDTSTQYSFEKWQDEQGNPVSSKVCASTP